MWGPLLSIIGFHPGCIKFCSMHTLNLGLMYACNGAALKLGWIHAAGFSLSGSPNFKELKGHHQVLQLRGFVLNQLTTYPGYFYVKILSSLGRLLLTVSWIELMHISWGGAVPGVSRTRSPLSFQEWYPSCLTFWVRYQFTDISLTWINKGLILLLKFGLKFMFNATGSHAGV